MHPKTGEMVEIGGDAEAETFRKQLEALQAQGFEEVTPEEANELRPMNRHQRRRWAKLNRKRRRGR